ncbi:hypothetical protein SGGMMB4_04280 [Sodalis glossinidius str. 'morsitans']|uniref:Mannitol dehydrogenase C-terminal domain-containing protein n=1 Tax=Sodalis glossinidius (strain morsitans) TaxID=343509 RepID=A0A193QLJ9_SODGM|nr:hypothetical protein SGGMMB4_04280 [Sodalis glossinidius str. 'morsitans']
MDGSQKLPQRMLEPIRQHLVQRTDYRHLAVGVAGWMRYILAEDEQGNAIEVVDPLNGTLQAVNRQHPSGPARVQALLGIRSIFNDDLPANAQFVAAVTDAYEWLCRLGARAAVEALSR